MNEAGCVAREPWELSFLAEPREVAGLRRVVRLHLKMWGLSRQTETAQLCVTEMVTQVIQQAGVGTPVSLFLSMKGTFLRVEVRVLGEYEVPMPASSRAGDQEAMADMLLGSYAERWGVREGPGFKATWCEIATDLTTPHGHGGGIRVTRAEAMISLCEAAASVHGSRTTRLTPVTATRVVIELIVDLLAWVDAHGYDADDILDAAQTRFDLGP
ncbi:ATP-binding protein [Streptomyces sp. NPDC056488]|uniref:ATP-binding protein n=1 Tax=unclassified Streptomyces TaxID=2593676 RepID=UPI0036BEBD84